jgi:hypothetical protein
MTVSNKSIVLVLLLSTLLILAPMFYFPSKFGIELATGSFTYSMFEIVFYGVIFYVFRPNSTLLQLVAGAGLTFLYRIVLGTILGALLSLFFHMGFSVSLALGVSRYLPAIVLHVIVSPFVMRPFFLAIVDQPMRTHRYHERRPSVSAADRKQDEPTAPYYPKSRLNHPVSAERMVSESRTGISIGQDIDGFSRAVRYLGEHHAVLLATVVDAEGLTMAKFVREGIDVDRWAPLSLMFQEANKQLLKRNSELSALDQIDLTFGRRRLVVVRIEDFDLLVLSNHEDDELLRIRTSQAADMIRKYTSERYGNMLPSGTEERYVSNT